MQKLNAAKERLQSLTKECETLTATRRGLGTAMTKEEILAELGKLRNKV